MDEKTPEYLAIQRYIQARFKAHYRMPDIAKSLGIRNEVAGKFKNGGKVFATDVNLVSYHLDTTAVEKSDPGLIELKKELGNLKKYNDYEKRKYKSGFSEIIFEYIGQRIQANKLSVPTTLVAELGGIEAQRIQSLWEKYFEGDAAPVLTEGEIAGIYRHAASGAYTPQPIKDALGKNPALQEYLTWRFPNIAGPNPQSQERAAVSFEPPGLSRHQVAPPIGGADMFTAGNPAYGEVGPARGNPNDAPTLSAHATLQAGAEPRSSDQAVGEVGGMPVEPRWIQGRLYYALDGIERKYAGFQPYDGSNILQFTESQISNKMHDVNVPDHIDSSGNRYISAFYDKLDQQLRPISCCRNFKHPDGSLGLMFPQGEITPNHAYLQGLLSIDKTKDKYRFTPYDGKDRYVVLKSQITTILNEINDFDFGKSPKPIAVFCRSDAENPAMESIWNYENFKRGDGNLGLVLNTSDGEPIPLHVRHSSPPPPFGNPGFQHTPAAQIFSYGDDFNPPANVGSWAAPNIPMTDVSYPGEWSGIMSGGPGKMGQRDDDDVSLVPSHDSDRPETLTQDAFGDWIMQTRHHHRHYRGQPGKVTPGSKPFPPDPPDEQSR